MGKRLVKKINYLPNDNMIELVSFNILGLNIVNYLFGIYRLKKVFYYKSLKVKPKMVNIYSLIPDKNPRERFAI